MTDDSGILMPPQIVTASASPQRYTELATSAMEPFTWQMLTNFGSFYKLVKAANWNVGFMDEVHDRVVALFQRYPLDTTKSTPARLFLVLHTNYERDEQPWSELLAEAGEYGVDLLQSEEPLLMPSGNYRSRQLLDPDTCQRIGLLNDRLMMLYIEIEHRLRRG